MVRPCPKRFPEGDSALATVSGGDADGASLIVSSTPGDCKRVHLRADEHFAISPTRDPNGRDVVLISGAAGSGKSVAVRSFVTAYAKLWPDRHIILVTRLEGDDPSLPTNTAPTYVRKIRLASLVERPMELSEITKCCVIMDDTENLVPAEAEAVQTLQELVCQQGRHTQSTLIVANHLACNGKSTRVILAESQWVLLFPHGTSASQCKRVLETYCGLGKQEVKAFRRCQSRWVALRKLYPPCVVYDGGAYLVNEDL
jgi:hypothetical protein